MTLKSWCLWLFYHVYARFNCEKNINGKGYKINKPLSGLLVCRLIMSLAERLSSKFHIYPRSFASFFRQSLSRGHYQPTCQPPEGVYLQNHSRYPKSQQGLKLDYPFETELCLRGQPKRLQTRRV